MKYLLIIIFVFLSGCASTNNNVMKTDAMRIIEQTAAVAPKAVAGDFVFTVQATGDRRRIVYLNTELDYRDRRNITIALSPKVAAHLKAKFGVPAQQYFLNKTVKVAGAAKQMKIWFFANGQRTDSYYYQTHIRVTSPDQIEVLG